MRTIRLVGRLILICGAVHCSAQSPVANTPEGFQQQFHAIFEASQQQNQSAMQDRLQSFALPSHWFTDSFAAAQAPEFARQYAEAFADFRRRTAANFAGIDALKTRLHVDVANPVDIRTRRWTPAESRPASPIPGLRVPVPTMEEFEIDYVLAAPRQGARLTSWIESFIYVDGAFRFFGRDRNPFWMTTAPSSKSPHP